MKTIKTIFLLVLSSVLYISCLEQDFADLEKDLAENNGTQDFTYRTVEDIEVTLKAEYNGHALDGVYVEIHAENPYGENNQQSQSKGLFSGITDKNGSLITTLSLATRYDSLYIVSKHIGIRELTGVLVNSNKVTVCLGCMPEQPASARNAVLKSTQNLSPTKQNGYFVLGTWDNQGKPNYLEPVNSTISQGLLDDLNASLPEGTPLPESHPQYLSNPNDGNLQLIDEAEVWVTFVHEGAGWLNMLGYFTYPTNSPPATISEIRDLTVIFPNVSFLNSGGGLVSGNKVQLHYLDPETNEYTTLFPANTSVGWFITAKGWNGSTITSGRYTHYSIIDFNAEADVNLKKHNVLLYDEQRNLLLMGFEDIRRDQRSDQDFNDAVFYTEVSPFSAVDNSIYQPIDNPTDTDGDGVSNVFDQYPNDAARAFNNYYPSENSFGTLVFEDLWPYKGDYDFNDLVIDYNFNQITNGSNQIVEIESRTVVRAIGASFHNAFGVQLNTNSGNVSSVSGQNFKYDVFNILSSGAEANQSKATVLYFDNAYNELQYPGTDLCVNTYPDNPFVQPDTQKIQIQFNNPVSIANLGTPPYNPFIIIDQDRGKEVHLPNYKPTDLADPSILGTGHDDSNPSLNKYYVSEIYLPWAINLPESFEYPAEKEDITASHLMFGAWANSLGYSYMDWYRNKTGYRNSNKIYKRK